MTAVVRVRLVCAVVAIAVAAACAPKPAPAPPTIGALRYPDFVFPAYSDTLAAGTAGARHDAAWRWLQAGDLRAAERDFQAVLKTEPSFYPSRAALGYVALAHKEPKDALAHFDRALEADPRYAPALAGRGEAMLALGNHAGALASFEGALAADPSLATLRGRVDSLRFRVLEENVGAARKAAEAGRLDEARTRYERALAASPDSPFLHRELAGVERRANNLSSALAHAVRASELDPSDPRAFILAGDIYEALSEFAKAAEAFESAAALDPSDEALIARIDALRERAAFAAMPPEYQAIESAPTVTRAQLAALLGVHLDALLKRARSRPAVIMTDTRGNWAAPWIMSVTRAGVMEPFANHAFQPNALVRRLDLAQAASRVLALIAAEKPRVGARWRNARRRFPDLPPGHLSHPAASVAVEAGVMAAVEDGAFQPSRLVTGAEAVKAVRKLRDLDESSR